MKRSRHRVTDHAIVRYLERVKGVDMDRLRREIGQRVDHATTASEGACGVVIDGFRYVLSPNSTIVTVEKANRRPRGQKGRRPKPRVERGIE